MTRKDAREFALKALFALAAQPELPPLEVFTNVSESLEGEEPSGFAKQLFFGTAEHMDEFDAKIEAAADNWKLSRISRVALSVLRLALFEITYMPDIGVKISINEALELARSYEDEKTVSFVNGVLGKLVNG